MKINKFYRVTLKGHDVIDEKDFKTLKEAKDFIKNFKVPKIISKITYNICYYIEALDEYKKFAYEEINNKKYFVKHIESDYISNGISDLQIVKDKEKLNDLCDKLFPFCIIDIEDGTDKLDYDETYLDEIYNLLNEIKNKKEIYGKELIEFYK